MKDDPDLQPLHTDKRFAALVTYAQQRTTKSAERK